MLLAVSDARGMVLNHQLSYFRGFGELMQTGAEINLNMATNLRASLCTVDLL